MRRYDSDVGWLPLTQYGIEISGVVLAVFWSIAWVLLADDGLAAAQFGAIAILGLFGCWRPVIRPWLRRCMTRWDHEDLDAGLRKLERERHGVQVRYTRREARALLATKDSVKDRIQHSIRLIAGMERAIARPELSYEARNQLRAALRVQMRLHNTLLRQKG